MLSFGHQKSMVFYNKRRRGSTGLPLNEKLATCIVKGRINNQRPQQKRKKSHGVLHHTHKDARTPPDYDNRD